MVDCGSCCRSNDQREFPCSRLSKIGLKVELDNIVVDESRHKEEVKPIPTGRMEPVFPCASQSARCLPFGC